MRQPSIKVWMTIIALAVVTTYWISTRKRKHKGKSKVAKKQHTHQQTQTNPLNNSSHQNAPKPTGKMAQINGIIVKEYVDDTYQMQLIDNQKSMTRTSLKIPKHFVQIQPHKIKSTSITKTAEKHEKQQEEKKQHEIQQNTTQQDEKQEVEVKIDSLTQSEQKLSVETEDIEHIMVQIDPALSAINDITSIRLSYDTNGYNIGSIKYIDPLITCQYPYLKQGCVIIQSSVDPNVIYFFNKGHNFNYKYIINKQKWQKISVVPEKDELEGRIKCFYLNYKQGLIGVLCNDETKIRIYNEIKDEWSCVDLEIKDKVKGDKSKDDLKIGNASLALDTKNMIYHFVDFRNHF
eukprot:460754_1